MYHSRSEDLLQKIKASTSLACDCEHFFLIKIETFQMGIELIDGKNCALSLLLYVCIELQLLFIIYYPPSSSLTLFLLLKHALIITNIS